jgi:PAS domain S-box-containing protein
MNNFPKLFEGHYEYLLQEVLESIDDAVLVFDSKQTVVYANEAAEEVFGDIKVKIVGKSIKRLIPKNKQSYFDSIISTLNKSERHEFQLEAKKEFVGLRSASHFFYAEGKLAKFKKESAYILVLRDNTWRKAVEGELETALDHLKIIGRQVAYRVEHPSILDEFPPD